MATRFRVPVFSAIAIAAILSLTAISATQVQNAQLKIPGNATVTITVPDGVLKPATWSDSAADVFPADKQQHCFHKDTRFALAIGGTPAAREEIVYVASADGVINKFAGMLNDTGTSTDVDFVLKKNGSEIMASDLTITHAAADRTVSEGSLDSVAYSQGDVFSIELVVTSSTGAQGPFAWVEFLEAL